MKTKLLLASLAIGIIHVPATSHALDLSGALKESEQEFRKQRDTMAAQRQREKEAARLRIQARREKCNRDPASCQTPNPPTSEPPKSATGENPAASPDTGASTGVVGPIVESGKNTSGKTTYKFRCAGGREWRIWFSDGEWWDGLGAQGGNSRNLTEQANFLCR